MWCRALKQLARPRRASRGSPARGPRIQGRRCDEDDVFAWDRSGVEEAIERATRLSDRIFLQLAPWSDGEHAPLPFVKRRDGVPCDAAVCDYAFVLAVPTRSRASAERQAREQLPGRPTRYFVELRLRDACVMSCEHLAQIDEPKLRAADPTATATLRALRDAGADVLFVRGSLSSRIAVVFQQSVGHRVHVVDEAAASVGPDGRWVLHARAPARAPDRRRSLVRQPQWLKDRPRAGRVAWELAIAVVCFLVTPPTAEVAGTRLTVPLWAEVLLGAMAAGMAVAITWRARCSGDSDDRAQGGD